MSEHKIGAGPENGSSRRPRRQASVSSETAYDRLAGYGFARRYVGGKTVAHVGREVGYGTRLLSETAGSVTGLAASPAAVEEASAAYPAPNVDYRRADLPELPYPEDHFDAVVAFEMAEGTERPESFVAEARRVLREDGVLIVSVPDKRAHAYDRDAGGVGGGGGMYVPDLAEMLGRHFGDVRLFRQGAVAGGFVFPVPWGTTETAVEVASPDAPGPGDGPPLTRSVVAVCAAAGVLGREDAPYLSLDRDRRVFDEVEDLTEDVELLRSEVRQMQETEVQVFRDTIELRRQAAARIERYLFHLRNYRIHLRNISTGVNRKLSRAMSSAPDKDERP